MTDPEQHDADEQIGAVSASPADRPATSTRHTRLLGAAVAVLVVVLLATSAFLWDRSRRLDDELTATRQQVTQMRDGVASFKKCVNVYMQTIGQWSTDVNSRYNYRFC